VPFTLVHDRKYRT